MVLHRRRGRGGGGQEVRQDESHAFLAGASCPPCHKNNKHAGERGTGGEVDTEAPGNRMYFSGTNAEPIRDARRRTFIPALPHLW